MCVCVHVCGVCVSVAYLECASSDLVQGHGSVQVPLVQLSHVHPIQLLKVGGHQKAVVCNNTTQVRILVTLQHNTNHVRVVILQHSTYNYGRVLGPSKEKK